MTGFWAPTGYCRLHFISYQLFLDPRFKAICFKNEPNIQEVFSLMNNACKELQLNDTGDKSPPPKSLKASNVLELCLGEVSSKKVNELSEIGEYLNEPVIADKTALEYWKKNSKYPTLKLLAQKYLSAPPSTISDEKLFSELGNIYHEKRSRLFANW